MGSRQLGRLLARTRGPVPVAGSGRAPGWMSISRGAAAGVALICAMNLSEMLVFRTETAAPWLTLSTLLPADLNKGLLALTIPALLLFAVRPNLPSVLRLTCLVCILLPAVFCVQSLLALPAAASDTVRFGLMARPIGVLLMLAVAVIGVLLGGAPSVQGRSSWLAMLFACLLTVVSFPLLMLHEAGFMAVADDDVEAQLVLVPTTTDEQPGRLSEQLEDRIRTAAEIVLRSADGRLLLLHTGADPQIPSQEQLRQTALDSGLSEQQVEVRDAGDDAVAWLQLATAESESGTAPLFVTHWYEVARLQRQALRHAPAVQVRAALQRHAILGQNLLVLKETQRLLQVLLDPLLQFARTMRSPSETERRDPYSAMDTETETDDLSELIEPISEESTAP